MKQIIDFIEASDFFIDWLLLLCGLTAVIFLLVLLYRCWVVLGLLQRIAKGLKAFFNFLKELITSVNKKITVGIIVFAAIFGMDTLKYYQ